MVEFFLILMLGLRMGDMGVMFWVWLGLLFGIKFTRFVIWVLKEN